MKIKPNEPKLIRAINDEPELVLDKDDLTQIAKFLDALLEVDMTNKSNERKQSNESVLSHSSDNNIPFEPLD